jgi:hypothetical protein
MRIGGYLYLIRGEEYQFPYVECIKSILPFCDEVYVLTDERFKDSKVVIEKLGKISQKVHVCVEELDLNDPGVDGKTKAKIRNIASENNFDWLYQTDADEVFREKDISKITRWVNNTGGDIVSCGVINWFNGNHIKLSSPFTKERFSRNVDYITHGIPVKYRIQRDDFFYIDPLSPTDGAGYIDLGGNPLAGDSFSFHDKDNIIVSQRGKDCIAHPEFYVSIENDIWIHHYSWYNIPRRWQRENTWNYFWGILRGKYHNLEEYQNSDGKAIDFWKLASMRSPESYYEPIKKEMEDKAIYSLDWIKHPEVMQNWLNDQASYIHGQKRQKLCKPRFFNRLLYKRKKQKSLIFE